MLSRNTISLSICVFCCTLLGLLVQSLDGFPGRLGDSSAAALSSKNTFPKQNKYAKVKYGCSADLEFCWAPENSQPSLALIGDSHAHHLVVQSINTLLIKQMRTQCLQASISSGRSPVPHSLA